MQFRGVLKEEKTQMRRQHTHPALQPKSSSVAPQIDSLTWPGPAIIKNNFVGAEVGMKPMMETLMKPKLERGEAVLPL